MSQPYSAISIANYLVQKAIDQDKALTPLQLVKIIYIAHGWYLALADKPLIGDSIQAWKYGPVVRPVYDAFKKYGDQRIVTPHPTFSDRPEEISTEDKAFLDKIFEVYRDFTGPQLTTLTHAKDTPWHVTWEVMGGKEFEGAIIPNDVIKRHYENKAKTTST